jgi:diacylglycerol kinase (ATP)
MKPYSAVSIIYNPNSTGPSKHYAKELKAELAGLAPSLPVKIIATKYAGHAETLANKLAKSSTRPIIVSSSGDGGYNEVINGVLAANKNGAHAVAGLLPAGNANDHYTDLHSEKSLAKRIAAGSSHTIDVLQVTSIKGSTTWQRYAHSYVGFGLTPHAGHQLNKANLNFIREKWVVLRALVTTKPIQLRLKGKKQWFDHIICSNITKMAKVLSLSNDADARDGMFELTVVQHAHSFALLFSLFRSAASVALSPEQTTDFECTAIKPIKIQLDGELVDITANTTIAVKIAPRALPCLI